MLSELLLTDLGLLGARDKVPLHRQVYEVLRRAILDGRLGAGDRLPSSRQLMRDLNLSRNTVVSALNQLTIEGYLVTQVGSGTFVSDRLAATGVLRVGTLSMQSARLSQRGTALATTYCASQLEIQPFTPGIADFSAFPVAQWLRLQNKHWRMNYPDMLDYSYSGGYAPLRRAVAQYLRVSRSVQVDAEQVIITSGTQQSMELCAQLLADHGDTVWMEDPAYWGAVKAFLATGLRLHAVPVDRQGIAPLPSDDAMVPRLIYVTPSHQYPTGAVMTLERRQQILAVARRHSCWVLEDDYDTEFRFDAPPLSSLSGMDQDGRVLYMGTFSKVLYPGLKLGYLVVPVGLVETFKQAHYDLNRPGQMQLQAALAEFIEMGYFANALRHARSSYGLRRRSLLEALKPCLDAGAWISGAEQGLHLCLRLHGDADDVAMANRIGELGLTVRPLSAYCIDRQDLRGLVIGYGYAALDDIRRHGPDLAQAILREIADLAPAPDTLLAAQGLPNGIAMPAPTNPTPEPPMAAT
ncbi:MAG: PLP-dependent aminotransferase family protein [Burkholderiaceae bacterium]